MSASEGSSQGERIEISLRTWIDDHLVAHLREMNEPDADADERWELPMIEDYVLVVSIKDYADGEGGIFAIGDRNTPGYRVRGLLADALRL